MFEADEFAQAANPYSGQRNYAQDPRRRALAQAVQGGQQIPQQNGANVPPAVQPEVPSQVASAPPRRAPAPSRPSGGTPPSGNAAQQMALRGAIGGVPGMAVPPEAPPVETPAPAGVPPVFQSQNKSISGFLQEAMAAKRPEIIGLQDEAARKSMAQEYIKSLVPQLQGMGANVGDVRNEKLQIDGNWVDLLRDIEGEAGIQYLVEDPQQAALQGALGGSQGPNDFVSQNRMPWESANTQTGGDALQAIYKLLGPLMGQIQPGL